MTPLETKPFLVIDCQTTGMRPSAGHLLEIAWAWVSASTDASEVDVSSYLVRLPEGAWLPPRVQEITGLRAEDLKASVDVEIVRTEFLKSLAQSQEDVYALIHYAQFEEPFLFEFLKNHLVQDALPFKSVCTHKIAKRLFPTVPSRNIRGLTGFFGSRIGEIKRASQHVRATHLIWKSLVAELSTSGVFDLDSLLARLSEAPKKKPSKDKSIKVPSYEYRVDRAKRLALPPGPGIYKMKSKEGEVLYVGKATSLKDRVNSYFRGKKGRDPRKLEMMAQVWDLDFIECNSAIEAALIESDEIKRLDPPYNVSLKNRNRALMFYSRDLELESEQQTVDHPVGPFRRFSSLGHLRDVVFGLRRDEIVNAFHQPVEPQILGGGFEQFVVSHPEFNFDSQSLRAHLAFGIGLYRKSLLVRDELIEIDEDLTAAEEELTVADVAEKFEKLYARAGASYLRSKRMTGLLWANIRWMEKGEAKFLAIRRGRVLHEPEAPLDRETNKKTMAWVGLDMADYDRVSILISEVARFPHEIDKI